MNSAQNKAVFLDRDGTLINDYGYNCDIEKIDILPGATAALKLLQSLGFKLIIVTNQSGVARGYFTEEQLIEFNAAVVKKFKSEGVDISATYYCPHLEGGIVSKYALRCDCRKPNVGLFLRAAGDFSLDMSKCWNVGDSVRDCSISHTTGCKSILIGNRAKFSSIDGNVLAVDGWSDIIDLIKRGILY